MATNFRTSYNNFAVVAYANFEAIAYLGIDLQ